MTIGEVNHRDDCDCTKCTRGCAPFMRKLRLAMMEKPVQEADGHLRGCPRLGTCGCPASAPRDPFFCEHSERQEACWPCAQKEKKP